MTEHKFTDEEVIKALECCCKDNYEGDCPKCPLQLNGNCNVILAEHALDLINRQKAEIEELTVSNERLEQTLTFYALQYGTVRDQSIVIETARVEAIKEFAARLKEKLIKGGIYPALVKNSINDLVKEITEEQK